MRYMKKEGPQIQQYNLQKTSTMILTDEKQLDRIIAGPDTPIFEDEELGYSNEKKKVNDSKETLRSTCERLQKRGCDRMEVSYDFFFGGTTRCNYPSDETTIKAFKAIHDAAKEHGMGFGASILNPLDIGGGWAKISDETGFSYQFLETDIKPDGSYCANMVCQRQWYNNKGPIQLKPVKAMAFAFNEERVGDTPYFYVDENAIADISETAAYAIEEEKTVISKDGYGSCPMTISGQWANPTANRVLCIMVYRTPELDYFAPSAAEFMKKMLDMHNEAGISYQGFYSDEMHIQFDWDLNEHFGESEINTRYLTDSLAKAYAAKYGEKYLNFPKYLIYMAYHQHDFLPGDEGKENAQHVFGKTPEAISETWLFRNRYFELLQRTVVDLCKDAKDYAEKLWGAPIMTQAHATWQESPTCDHYYRKANAIGGMNMKDDLDGAFDDVTPDSPVERQAEQEMAALAKAEELGVSRYEYTKWYDWSSSIRENTSACYDYFKWNEYLTGGGSDHPEGGNLDRNYYGNALSASFAELNRYGVGYCACWGMPNRVASMFGRVTAAYGNTIHGTAPNGREVSFVNGMTPRITDVLALYPIKLNNVEERFGSWMVQYGYCNYITEEKLLENASVTEDGCLCVKGRKYRCLVVLFEPFMSEKTFELIEKFLSAGGKVLWMSIPALSDSDGTDATARFMNLFGLKIITPACAGEKHAGGSVRFSGSLAGVQDMQILTDMIVDMVYPCEPDATGEAVAQLNDKTVAVRKAYPKGGCAVYAGFRLRDDQSRSLGEDIDTLFRVLCAMEAYRPDSLEVRSRKTESPYLYNTFADGSIAVAPHFRDIGESWDGRFFRDEVYDAAILAAHPKKLMTAVTLNETIAGHKIEYSGDEFLAYRLNEQGAPIAYFGIGAKGLTVDGKEYTFADRDAKLEFAPVPAACLENGIGDAVTVTCWTENAALTIPAALTGDVRIVAFAKTFFDEDGQFDVPFEKEGSLIKIAVTPELVGKRMLIIKK